jgi:hypothetical protein
MTACQLRVVVYLAPMHFSRFLYTVISKALYIISTRKSETKWAIGYIQQLEKQFDGRFDDLTFKKIVNSYAIYNPMLCDAFALLHGRVTNREERIRMLHYFICSSLFDNFYDRKELTSEEIRAISFNPVTYHSRGFDEKIFLHSHVLLKNYVRDQQNYEVVTQQLFKAQQDSMKQFGDTITDEEIKKVTFAKGGYSVLLCSFYLENDASAEEQQCWYRIGSIIQLTNDLFDIYKDLQDGSHTLATRMTNANAFNQFFMELVDQLKEEIRVLPYNSAVKRDFTMSMMGICAFGWIALAQLRTIQGDRFSLPKLASFPRKDLVIDMEKPENLWRWIKWVYHLGKL